MSITDTSESVRLTDQQRLDWLRLIRSENVGPRTFRALVIISAGPARRSMRFPLPPGAAAQSGREKSIRWRTPNASWMKRADRASPGSHSVNRIIQRACA